MPVGGSAAKENTGRKRPPEKHPSCYSRVRKQIQGDNAARAVVAVVSLWRPVGTVGRAFPCEEEWEHGRDFLSYLSLKF